MPPIPLFTSGLCCNGEHDMDGAKLNADNIARNNRLMAKANARMEHEEHEAELAALRAEVERLREERDKFRALVEDAYSPGMFGEWHTVGDPVLHHTDLQLLCRTYGFGAVMHYVEYIWRIEAEANGHAGSEHTCAATAFTRRKWLAAARAALEGRE